MELTKTLNDLQPIKLSPVDSFFFRFFRHTLRDMYMCDLKKIQRKFCPKRIGNWNTCFNTFTQLNFIMTFSIFYIVFELRPTLCLDLIAFFMAGRTQKRKQQSNEISNILLGKENRVCTSSFWSYKKICLMQKNQSKSEKSSQSISSHRSR